LDTSGPQAYSLHHFASPIIVIDRCKRILDMNYSFGALTGFSPSEIFGKDYDLLLTNHRIVQNDIIQASAQMRKECYLQNYILKTRADQRLLVDVHVVPTIAEDLRNHIFLFVIPNNSSKAEYIQLEKNTIDLEKYGWFGSTVSMYEVSYLIQAVSPVDATVLIQGETGTGKEVVANIIYQLSMRSNKMFKVINCATLSENLLENELFGHEKGAYTGAVDRYIGLFETATEGTVFLDEIGEISPGFQAKLLRVLECGEYSRIGSVETRKTNVRIIAATNRDLKQMIQNNEFRKDLYYRLSVFPIHIPPLRNRIMDIPFIIDYFIGVLNNKYQRNKTRISDIAMTLLFRYSFPGNVRELKNIIEHSYIKSRGSIIHDYDLPEYLYADTEKKNKVSDKQEQDAKIVYLMGKFKGNKTKVAEALSISRKTLYQKLATLDHDFEQ
jgi:PAS domain S-box-containing protein